MPLPIKEYIPRMVCTDDRLKKMRELKVKTDGYVYSMEDYLKSRGFGLPVINEEQDGFEFMINFKYYHSYINYADSLSEEIIALYEHGLININSNGKKK